MKKAIFIVTILFVAVISTACINNMAVQELNNAAKTYMEKGDYDTAINRLESSIELDATIYETHYNLGVAYINAKKYPQAIDILNKAIQLNSKYANTYYTLAVAQEDYADSLVNQNDKTPDSKKQPNDDISITDTYKNLPVDIKEIMIENYLSSITNYKKYIEMVNSSQKEEEINSHISDMEKVLSKLGYNGSSY